MRFALLGILMLASVGAGPATQPDDATREALEKMRQRQAARAPSSTQPAAITQAELDKLRSDMAVLQKQLTDLKKQLADVTSERDGLQMKMAAKAEQVKPSIANAIRDGKVIAGMTDAQAEAAMKQGGIKYMTSKTSEELVEGRRVVYRIWTPNSFYEGYKRIISRSGVIVEVQQ